MYMKAHNTGKETVPSSRKIDLRNVMIDEETDLAIDEYVLLQRRGKRRVKKGEAAVELIVKGLKAEGIA